MSDTDARQQFLNAQKRLDLAVRQLWDAAESLPALPVEVRCCDQPDLRLITSGLAQHVMFQPDDRTALSNGWEDMGDMAGPQHIECMRCLATFAVPRDVNWR